MPYCRSEQRATQYPLHPSRFTLIKIAPPGLYFTRNLGHLAKIKSPLFGLQRSKTVGLSQVDLCHIPIRPKPIERNTK